MGVSVSATKAFFWVFLVSFLGEICNGDGGVFNVNEFGAKPDGITDNSAAFSAAWKGACGSKGQTATLVIPEGTYLTGPVEFNGPCTGVSNMIVEVAGVVKAPTDLSKFHDAEWIIFRYIDKLLLRGGGVFDGQGKSAWPYNDCSKNPHCKTLPTTLQFTSITNSIVSNISLVDSKQKHMKIFRCRKLDVFHVTITAPGDSPNTDGINISESTDIGIYDSNIGTGDDCISAYDGSEQVFVSNVSCGPGHGISVGSLGGDPNEKDVRTFSVTKSYFTGTQNGVRIKTWVDSKCSISATNFTFENLIMNNVRHPITIDQHYCPTKTCSTKTPSTVKISDVSFKEITGTSATNVAVSLSCSETYPCQDITLENINLKPSEGGDPLTSFCSNVKGSTSGIQIPPACI